MSHACFQVSAYWIQTESTVLAINFSPQHIATSLTFQPPSRGFKGLLAKRLAPASSETFDLCNSGWRESRGAGSSSASPLGSLPALCQLLRITLRVRGPTAAAGEALVARAAEKGGKGREYLLLNASCFGSYSSVACGESCPSFCSGLAAAQ